MEQTLENITAEFELMRFKALNNLDSVKYAVLCNYFGVAPENDNLYTLGLMSDKYLDVYEEIDWLYAQKLVGSDKKSINGSFKLFPSNSIYVPSTITGLKMEIRQIYKKKGGLVPKGFSKMGKKTQRPSVINMSYKQAEAIMHEYNEQNEIYLRSLIKNHIPNYQLVLDCSDTQNILHHTRTIKGVAEKMLRTHTIFKSIAEKIKILTETINQDERDMLEDRICVRLEECKFPGKFMLEEAYKKAQKTCNK